MAAVIIRCFITSAIIKQLESYIKQCALKIGRDATSMGLTIDEFGYLAKCLEGFLFGELPAKPLSKEVQSHPMPGLYTGIFTMYLYYHASNKRTGDNTKSNIIFYAICGLYVLSVAVNALGIVLAWLLMLVSNNERLFFNCALIICTVQSVDISVAYRLDTVIGPILFGCTDVIAQFILVCTYNNSYSVYLSNL